MNTEPNEKIIELIEKTHELSKQSVLNGTGPFGCIITDTDYNIISQDHNRVTELNDPTAHAEINAIRNACNKIKNFTLNNHILFTSCEPCPMCLSAIYWARIDKIYFSNTRSDAKLIGFDDELIYEELKKEIDEREIKIKRITSTNSLESFELWKNKSDKVKY
jgi:tRNA(Arg) A34 adenosine deaminase TadA